MDVELAANLLRMVFSLALAGVPLLYSRRKWIAKVFIRAARIADENEKAAPMHPGEYLATATAQNTAIESLRDLVVMNQESQERDGRDIRNQIDSLLTRQTEDRREWRGAIEAIKGGLNNVSERVYALEHPPKEGLRHD